MPRHVGSRNCQLGPCNRQHFNAVESQFQVLDRPVELFRATPQERDMIAAWQASRVIRDLGHGPSSPPPEEDPAPEVP